MKKFLLFITIFIAITSINVDIKAESLSNEKKISTEQSTPNLIIYRTSTPPTVDGVTDDKDPWTDEWIPLNTANPAGTTNAMTAKFQLMAGDDAFYVAIKVNDATPNSNASMIPNTYERDCSELYFSMDTVTEESGEYKTGTWQIRTQREGNPLNDGNSGANTWSIARLTGSPDFQAVSKNGATEYTQELILPYSVLTDGMDPAWDEQYFRFDVEVSDNTTTAAGGRTQQRFWFTNNDTQWNNTKSFGIVKIEDSNTPKANAGKDQTVRGGSTITLDGSKSTNPEGTPLTYQWTAPDGITLSSASDAKPTFVAPYVADFTTYLFTLTVNNGIADSKTDKVIITVRPANLPPVANAGSDQSVRIGKTVTLNGSASSDPDGDTLTYLWTAPEGITLSSATDARPTFVSPEVEVNTNYIFSLVVNDGKVNSDTDQITITIWQADLPPFANAGTNQWAEAGYNVTLDGSASYDANEKTLTYQWIAPTGITLSSSTDQKPTFVIPTDSTETSYTFTLIVNNGNANSTSDEVTIYVHDITISSKIVKKTEDIRIFPNPVNDGFNITGISGPTTIKLFDLTGHLVLYRECISNGYLRVAILPKGIYSAEIQTPDNLIRKKIIKE